MWVGNILADLLERIGPKGLEFAAYSLDYHVLRNYLLVYRRLGKERTLRHMPAYAKKIVENEDYKDIIAKQIAKGEEEKTFADYVREAFLSLQEWK